MDSRSIVCAFVMTLAAAVSFGAAAQPFPAKPAQRRQSMSPGSAGMKGG